MKALFSIAAVALSLVGSMGSASAQPYGDPYGYRERRGYEYRERDYGYGGRGPRYRDREYAFSEREYLRCNRDVLRAIYRGEFGSGFEHYQRHGRREGRRLRC